MSMSDTANLHLPFLAQGQAQKHVTINETLLRLDALLQLSVESASTSAEPASPSDGQVYILPAGKSGAHWSAMANGALAYYRDGVWEEIAPREGWRAWARDSDAFLIFTGAAWSKLAGVPAGGAAKALAYKIDAADFHTGWASALFWDESNARLGVGVSAPDAAVTVSAHSGALPAPPSGTAIHVAGADAGNPRLLLDAFGGNPLINFRRAAGTLAAPAALASGEGMGGFNWFGRTATGYSAGGTIQLSGVATENWSDAAQGCALAFFTTPNGSTVSARAERLRIDQDGALVIRANAQVLVDANGVVRDRVFTVATLPAGVQGMRAMVSDASTTTFNATVAGGGSNAVPVFYDGAAWKIG